MASSAVLELVLKMKDEASSELKKVEGNLGGVNKAALALGGGAAIGVGALAKGLWDCVEAAKEEEVGIAKLKAAVDASGTSYETVSDSIETYIAAATRKTAFDDGDQREAISRLTTTTGDYQTALELMPLAMDLARAKGISLADASEIVGKVHEGNTGILSRYGIVLEEGATSQEALAAMQQKFGGQAEAYGNTFQGAQEKMGIAVGNLKETIGAALLPVLTTLFTKLADIATDMIPKVQQVMQDLQPVFETVWGAIRTVIETVMPIIKEVVTSVFGAIKTFLDDHGEQIKTVLQTAWDIIKNIIDTATGIIKGIIDAWTAVLKGDWQGVWDAVKGIVQTVWDGIKEHIDLILGLIKTLLGDKLADIGEAVAEAWENIKGKIIAKLLEIQAKIDFAWTIIKSAVQAAWGTIKDTITGVWDSIVTAVTGKVDDVRLAMGNAWNTIHGAAVRAFNAIKTAILTPIQEAKGAIDGLISGIISAWQRLGSFHIPLPHFRAGTRTASVAGISFEVPDIGIDWYGKGLPSTVFDKPTLIGVGERGPERVTVTPLGKEGGAAAGGGVTITGNTFIVRSDQDIERIARAIYQQMMAQTGQRIALGQGVYVP